MNDLNFNYSDANLLYDGFVRSRQNSSWKPQVQMYEKNFLSNIAKSQNELRAHSYKTKPPSEFVLNERGKVRPITGLQMSDRVVRHAFCDNVLVPALTPYLIYDNGASIENRGISFSRQRIADHLRRYYINHGSNDGYILIMDFSKFYDNIPHEKAYEEIRKHIKDENALWMLRVIFQSFEIDVSYMTDEEFAHCLENKFDSLEYRSTIPMELRTGEKMMRKLVDIGDQASQIIGVYYPTKIDNYVKIVRHQKYYHRYMDDSYIISDNKEELLNILDGIKKIAAELGIHINHKKTRIVKLSKLFRFLQIGYYLTDTGRVVQKINPKRITAMRRRLRKLYRKMLKGEIPFLDIYNMYQSWKGTHRKYMSKDQLNNLDLLFCSQYREKLEGR